jgi:hypothetical protein
MLPYPVVLIIIRSIFSSLANFIIPSNRSLIRTCDAKEKFSIFGMIFAKIFLMKILMKILLFSNYFRIFFLQ